MPKPKIKLNQQSTLTIWMTWKTCSTISKEVQKMISMTCWIILRLNSPKCRSRIPRISSHEIISYQTQGQAPVACTSRTTLDPKERGQERIHQPAVERQVIQMSSMRSRGQTGTQTRSNASIHLFINVPGHQVQATARRDRTSTVPFPMLTNSRSNHSPYCSETNSRPCH